MNDAKAVLLVDDDRDLLLGASLRLRAAGYRTDTAHDGREGVEKAQADLPIAIVMDVQMPDMDGLTALEHLQQNQSTHNIPIIMLSASLVDRQAALEAGARFFVTKPYESSHLLKAIQRAIEEQSNAESS